MIESLIATSALLVIAFMRVPIGFAMALIGGLGFVYFRGLESTGSMIASIIYDTGMNYSLSVIPLFIFMGNILSASGVADGLFAAANRLFRRVKGGLALGTVLSCGGFSAICGSSLATAATMSKVAMPSMRRFGYSESLSTGAIAAGGTLGILIPPSVVMIIIGILTESDIGQLFMAGILPGILGIGLYLLAVLYTVRKQPDSAPDHEQAPALSRHEKICAFSTLFLFLFIMVGIYGGFFTPMEAAGLGAGVSIIIAWFIGSLTTKNLFNSLVSAAITSSMIFMIIIGADVFANFISYAGLPDELVNLVYEYDISPSMVILCILIIYLILGAIFESLSMILLTVPVFYPVITQLDFSGGLLFGYGGELLSDPENVAIWFAVVVVVVTEISLITPPVGMNVFVLKSVLPDTSLSTIFKGVWPFWVADMVRLALLVLIPWFSLALIF